MFKNPKLINPDVTLKLKKITIKLISNSRFIQIFKLEFRIEI